MDKSVPASHPIGHEHQMPVAPRAVLEKQKARSTRNIRSVKVAVMKFFIMPAPRKIPSATNLAETIK